MNKRRIVFFLILLGMTIFHTGALAQADKYELTQTDITTVATFHSKQVSVFGVSLGMSRAVAEDILRANPLLLIEQDKPNPTRLYVYDRKADGTKNKCVLYYIWEPDNPKLSSITVFPDCNKYLKGKTKMLLTFAVLDNYSDIRSSFLSYPDRSKVTLDIPGIAKTTSYYYQARGIEISLRTMGQENSIVFALLAEDSN